MTDITLKLQLSEYKAINSKYVSHLYNIGINTVEDLIGYYPYRHEDYSRLENIKNICTNTDCHILAKVINISSNKSYRRRMHISTATVSDQTGIIKIVWFNNRYINKYIKANNEYYFLGQVKNDKYGLYFNNPRFIPRDSSKINFITPVYSENRSLKSKWFSKQIKKIIHLAKHIPEFIPKNILKSEKLITIQSAIQNIHFPTSKQEYQEAIQRLKFNEIFLLQSKSFFQKNTVSQFHSKIIKKDISFIKKIIPKLPFTLTNDQKKALWDIMLDLAKKNPMNRLLQGDVGSGKTIVAILSIAHVANQKHQSVFIVPTEILAIQHFQNTINFLSTCPYDIVLFTSSQTLFYSSKSETIHTIKSKKQKENISKDISSGKIKIIISTHAIWYQNIKYDSLGLVIIDEQHRFGVKQRNFFNNIDEKYKPHLLTMTATPIPRSLAMTIYGHLTLSSIRTTLPDRKPIITRIVHPDQRPQCYQFIKNQLQSKHQIFIICPLIDESEKLDIKSATEEYEKIKNDIFPDYNVGLLHGQLKSKIKDKIMNQFSSNEIQILVSTSVIEVGIDVPNATAIIIEGSERFGLSQLHQFRGRVGRSLHQSYCFLFTDLPSPKVIQRLKVLTRSNDGFAIAEADLKLRGPGQLAGYRQSGIADIKMASLSDQEIIQKSYLHVKKLFEKDPTLVKHPLLKNKILMESTTIS